MSEEEKAARNGVSKKEQQKALEAIANPLMRDVYGAGGGAGDFDEDDEDDDGWDSEL